MKAIIPTSWADVTIKQFIEISKVPELGFDETDSKLKILEILTGISDEEYYKIETTQLKEVFKKISFIYSQPEHKGIKKYIKINGQRYRVRYEAKALTAGEYIDFQHFLKEGVNNNLEKLVAIYLHPVNILGFKQRKYFKKNIHGELVQTLESRERTEKLILEHMRMSEVFPISSFFLNVWGGLIRATQLYTERQLRKITKSLKKELKHSKVNMAGT